MKRIAVLGANGQLGGDIVKEADSYSNIDMLPLTRNDINVETAGFLDRLSTYKSRDYIINCISYHQTDECEDYPEKTIQINGLFPLHLAHFCAQNDITLFQISTDYVFDGNRNRPYCEDNPVNPLNVYGVSKAIGEFFVRQYCPKYFIIRVSSLFGIAGASGKGGNFVETMLRLAHEGKLIKVVGDQHMTPTHTMDVARAILKLIDNDISQYGIFHCSNSGSCSWYEFARTIFELCGIEIKLEEVTSRQYKLKARRPRYSVLDNRKISKLYTMPEWKEALKSYLRISGHLKMTVNS